MLYLSDFLMSNVVLSSEFVVIRPEILSDSYYQGKIGDINLRFYKKFRHRRVKRVEYTEDSQDTIVITLYDEENK